MAKRKPNRACRAPGCIEYALSNRGMCALHYVESPRSPEAVEYRKLYGTSAWRRGRDAFLRRHPLCAQCEERGAIVPATVVDHITPHRGDRSLFFNQDNWQALCETCHNIKSGQERFGSR